MRIFVAGATGVIGSRLVPALLDAGHHVTAIGRTPNKRSRLEKTGARAVDVSLFDAAALSRAVRGHDVIINVATHIPPTARMLLPGAWRENDRIRRDGSLILARAAMQAGAKQFIQESFAPVYQSRGDDWIDEDTPIAPVRYNRTVAAAEKSAALVTAHGGSGVVLRFGWFYGPDARHLGEMIASVRRGRAPLPGPAEAFVSSVSHHDAAAAVVAVLGAPAGIYNVVDDDPVTHREYFAIMAAALGVAPPAPLPAWVGKLMGSLGEMFSRSHRISNRKLRALGRWAPRYESVREGLPAALEGRESGSRRPEAEEIARARIPRAS